MVETLWKEILIVCVYNVNKTIIFVCLSSVDFTPTRYSIYGSPEGSFKTLHPIV
jgi:hypothetical protein